MSEKKPQPGPKPVIDYAEPLDYATPPAPGPSDRRAMIAVLVASTVTLILIAVVLLGLFGFGDPAAFVGVALFSLPVVTVAVRSGWTSIRDLTRRR